MVVVYCERARARKEFLEARKDKKLQIPSVMIARAGQACARVGARVAQGREGFCFPSDIVCRPFYNLWKTQDRPFRRLYKVSAAHLDAFNGII